MKVLRSGDYPAALRGFRKLDEAYPNNGQVHLGLGMAYGLNEEYAQSVEAYDQAILAPGVSIDHLRSYGTSLLFTGRFTDALGAFEEILHQKPSDAESSRLALMADSLEKLFTTHATYDILLLPFNTPANESAPSLYRGNLSLCRVRAEDGGLSAYVSEIHKRGDKYSFFRPLSLSRQDAKGWDEGAASWDENSGTLALTRRPAGSDLTRIWPDSAALLQIVFYTPDDNGVPENMKPFSGNSAQYSNAFPCFAGGGKYLLFASDRPGGFGGFDLYIVEKDGDSWSSPVNLGQEVNTPGNEIYPFLHADGALYWSSDYYKSQRDLDVYEALPDTGRTIADFFSESELSLFSEVSPMNESVNSAADDYGFVMEENRRHGFFCSNRAGGAGGDDVYALLTREMETSCTPSLADALCFEFYDMNNASTGPSSPFLYAWDFGDGTSASTEKTEHCYTGPGDYLVSFSITDALNGTLVSRTEGMVTARTHNEASIKCRKNIDVNQRSGFSALYSHIDGYRLIRYQWDFGDGVSATGAEVSHTYSTPGHYTVRLRIAGLDQGVSHLEMRCSTVEIEVNE